MFILKLLRLFALTVFGFISIGGGNLAEAPIADEYRVTLCAYEEMPEYTVEGFGAGYLLKSEGRETFFSDFYEAIDRKSVV